MPLIEAATLAGMLTNSAGPSGLAPYSDLTRMFVKKHPPRSESSRLYFGRTVDMNRIQTAILQADNGYMVNITDLEGEVLGLDPHLSAVLAKRFGAISSLDWEVLPAKGPNVDRVAAKEAADMVREHLQAIPFFGERLYDLLWANYDGRAILEIHWRMQAGRYQWRPVELRWVHPRRISFGPRFELQIINPWNTRGGFAREGIAPDEIPGKFVWWSPRLFREYPYREGLAPRTLYWTFFKRFSWRQRMTLTEIFALPWRIVSPTKEGVVQQPDYDDVIEKAEQMGRDAVMGVPAGMQLEIVQAEPKSGELMGMNSEEVNSEMSKLVLGNTGTTDATAVRAESIIHKGEQDIIAIRDAGALSARVTERLVKPDYMLNIDKRDTSACPTFWLKAEPMRDRAKELEVLTKTVALQVPVSVKQAREVTGMEEPEEGEPFITTLAGGVDPVTGQPTAGQPTIVDPSEQREPAKDGSPAEQATEGIAAIPQIPLTPTDIATIVTVNAALASLGLPPLQRPDGSLDPRGLLTIAEFQAKNAATIAQAAAAASGKEGPADGSPSPAAPPPGSVPADDETIEEQGLDGAKERAEADLMVRVRVGNRTVQARRSCLVTALASAGIQLAVARTAAEADVLGMQAQRDQRDAFSVSITREQNHGHVLVIPQRDLVEPDGPRQYNIKGEANHGHALMLTSEQLMRIGKGETVTTEAAPGGERPHTHFVAIARAVLAERPKTMPFGGFEDFDDCLRTVKKGDPSLSDEAARRICGELQAKEEEAARGCMAHLFELAQLERAEEDQGVMIALMLPGPVAEQLSVEGGEPADTLHITLAYLGKVAELPAEFREHALAAMQAAATRSIEAKINGLGRFGASEGSNGKDVVWASVDAPGLSELREALVSELTERGVQPRTDHGFTPHITLAYVEKGKTLDVPVPDLQVTFDEVELTVGTERTAVQLA